MRELKPIRVRGPHAPDYSQGFYRELPPAPLTADLSLARQFYRAVVMLLDREGWTRNETTSLRRLERRWRRRLDGDDKRWALVGAKHGRLTAAVEASLRPAPDPRWVGASKSRRTRKKEK